MTELPVVGVAENEAQDASDAVQCVDENYLELAVLGLELGHDRSRSRNVALAHRRGENEYPPASSVGFVRDAPRRTEKENGPSHEPEQSNLVSDKQKAGDQNKEH
jgi:hypothetical protein